MKELDIEIIILNYNGKEVLPDCLASIQENTDYENYNVTVVDNDSDDDSINIVAEEYREFGTIELTEGVGFSEANNKAIQNSDADVFLLLNNDTEVTPGWLSSIVEEFQRDRAGIVASKLVYPDGTPQFLGDKVLVSESHYPDLVIELWRNVERKFDKPKEIISGVGAALAIHRDVIEDIGLLDEAYQFYMEESDYCLKAKDAGYEIRYAPDSVVIHKSRSSSGENPYYEHYVRRRSRVRFYALNYSKTRLMVQLPFELFAFADAVVSGDMRWFLKAYRDELSNWKKLFEERKTRKQIHYTTNKINIVRNLFKSG